jgi:hypothetical protein
VELLPGPGKPGASFQGEFYTGIGQPDSVVHGKTGAYHSLCIYVPKLGADYKGRYEDAPEAVQLQAYAALRGNHAGEC